MRNDDLIDDVAKTMTAVETRPSMRARVMAGLDGAAQNTPRRWLMPVAAGATVGAVALAWFLVPSAPVTRNVPAVAQQTPTIAPVPAAIESPEVQVARVAPTLSVPRRVTAPRAEVPAEWVDMPVADIPTLPPLVGPPPIVIEPITWDDVTLAPLDVALIEVKALVIEPLSVLNRGGV